MTGHCTAQAASSQSVRSWSLVAQESPAGSAISTHPARFGSLTMMLPRVVCTTGPYADAVAGVMRHATQAWCAASGMFVHGAQVCGVEVLARHCV